MSEPKLHESIVNAPHADVQKMHPVVAAALAKGADPATLRELLELQRSWEAGEAKKSFNRALVAMKRELPTVIQKDAKVDFTNKSGIRTHYRHTSLAAAMEAVTEPLTRHGFSLSWTASTTERAVSITCRLVHADGHSEETTISAPPDTSGSKSAPQAVASTMTLLQRYSALALLGIATSDMIEAGPRENDTPPDDRIDTDRNMRAAGKLKSMGLDVREAEQFLERKVAEWTSADIASLKSWAENQRTPG